MNPPSFIKTADFVKSGTAPEHYPEWDHTEVAFAGRSNVGKSSLINSLVHRRKLVKTSKSPGHTQLINFFVVRFDDDRELGLVDLPGYGFAKVDRKTQAKWQGMIEQYFQVRKVLRALVIVLDIRRGLQQEDQQLIDAMAHYGIQPIPVFTKTDKLSRNKAFNRKNALAKQLGWPARDVLTYSSLNHDGRDALWKRIRRFAMPARSQDSPPEQA